MTDITELAQSLKVAAVNVKETAHIARYVKATIARKIFKELITPDNILALVEALEKAQQYAKERDAENQDLMLTVGRLRVEREELEPRSVKLPDDEDGQAYGFGKWANGKLPATAGTMTIAYCEDAWRAAFEVFSSAAGIKVETE